MDDTGFVYKTYIATTPEKLWEALTSPDFTEQYWSGSRIESDWRVGSPVLHRRGEVLLNSGELLEYDPPRRLAYTWVMHALPEFEAEGASRVTFEIEPVGPQCALTITHDSFRTGSRVRPMIANGWPLIASSLKTLLETGSPLGVTMVGGKLQARP